MDNKIYNYHQICEDIKNLDKKMQFVSVINENGKLVAGGINGSESIQNKRFYEDLYREVATRIKLRRKFDTILGAVKGTIVIRNRVITMNLPIKNDILFISADTQIDYSVIMEKILKDVLGVQND